MKKTKASSSMKTLERALTILQCFSFDRPSLTATEIASLSSIPKSTVHRFLRVFVDYGFIEEGRSPGTFIPGLRLFELGNIVRQSLDVRHCAEPFMQRIANELRITVHLVIRDGNEGIYIEKVEPEGQHIHYSHVGKRIPLYCTAAGKVLLSELPNIFIEEMYSFPLFPYTAKTITTKKVLFEELRRVRDCGWAQDNQELEKGLCCVGLPIRNDRGHIIAALSSSALAVSFTSSRTEELIQALQRASLEVSRRLGFTGADSL
ncbi:MULTISPECIES: IclR family transcriptional regulator [Aminobacterium]|uniref:IclR family transcriptional regulator n=2 Tax=Aminobacteriaceae TaxID=3029087 RepID=UPI00046531ED|nr:MULTISPECIES: IclR family transcriptional regulator [Aminobacterium]